MEVFKCTNPKCNKVLFEGEFSGTIKKKCPKCKKMNTFNQFNNNKLEKFCELEKKF
jgi:phage FluMu protein Com